MEAILAKFPKKRNPLPEAFQKIYTSHYIENREGNTVATSISKKMESWLHKQVAADSFRTDNLKTLEVGAGTLNQFQYEGKSEYYDIVEPFNELYENSEQLSKVRNVYDDIADIPEDEKYDRITSVATLEHICNLPEVVAKIGLMLNEGGCLRVSIPSEGTIMWTLATTFITGLEFRLRHGLNYKTLMEFEHVNTAKDIYQVLDYFFDNLEHKAFGLCPAFSFYQYFCCKLPKIKECQSYLDSLSASD